MPGCLRNALRRQNPNPPGRPIASTRPLKRINRSPLPWLRLGYKREPPRSPSPSLPYYRHWWSHQPSPSPRERGGCGRRRRGGEEGAKKTEPHVASSDIGVGEVVVVFFLKSGDATLHGRRSSLHRLTATATRPASLALFPDTKVSIRPVPLTVLGAFATAALSRRKKARQSFFTLGT
jgi:hypothetical protein